jgi:hypothetical protein
LAACFPSAVLVDFGKCAIVRFFFAALAAFLMFLRAAFLCFSLGILSPLVTFEVLHLALMGFGFFHARKSSQIAALAGLWIFLARIQTVLARLQLANHLSPSQILFFMMIAGSLRVAFKRRVLDRATWP